VSGQQGLPLDVVVDRRILQRNSSVTAHRPALNELQILFGVHGVRQESRL
jgi:hypothetical protein